MSSWKSGCFVIETSKVVINQCFEALTTLRKVQVKRKPAPYGHCMMSWTETRMDQDAFEIFPGRILPYSQGVLKEKTLHPDNLYFLFSFAQGTVSLELLQPTHIAPTQKWSTYLTNKHMCGTKIGSAIAREWKYKYRDVAFRSWEY